VTGRRLAGGLPLEVVVLASISFSVAVGFGIVTPVIALFAQQFGVGEVAAGAVVSVFAGMRLVSGLLGGRLVDRFPERTVLAAGLGLVALSSLAAGAAQSYAQFLVMRGLGGIGSALFTVSAFALMYRVVEPQMRGRAAGAIQSGFLLGGVMGPAIGGVLAEISLRAPFYVYAGTLAVATGIAWFALRRSAVVHRQQQTSGEQQARTSLRQALRSRAYVAALVTNVGTGWALFGVRSSLIPLYVADGLGLSTRWVGFGFVVSAAVQALLLLPAGRFVDRVGRKPAMIGGSLVAASSIAVLAVWATPVGFIVTMAAYGLGAALLGTAPAAVVGDVVGSRGGTVVAVSQMASDLGAIVGPLVAGLLAQNGSFTLAFAVTAAVVALGALVSTTMPETAPHRSARDRSSGGTPPGDVASPV
jgi:MFS family permease